MGFWEGVGNVLGGMAKKFGDNIEIAKELNSKSSSELKEMYKHIEESYYGIKDLGYSQSDKMVVKNIIVNILKKRGEI